MGKFGKKLHLKQQFMGMMLSRWISVTGVIALVLVMAYLLTPPPLPSYEDLEVGNKVWEDIKSNLDFTLIDEVTTEKRREQAERIVRPVFDYDSNMGQKLRQRLTADFANFRQKLRSERFREELSDQVATPWPQSTQTPQSQAVTENKARDEYDDFMQDSMIKMSFDTFQLLKSLNFSAEIEKGVGQIFDRISQYSIVANRNLLLEQAPNGLIRKDLATGDEKIVYNLDLVVSVEDAWREIDIMASRLFPDNQILQDISAEVARAMIRPNLTPNMQLTQARRKIARDSVVPVYYKVNAGEIVAHAGEQITPEIKNRLDYLNRMGQESRFGLVFLASLVFVCVLLAIVTIQIRRFHKWLLSDRNRLVLIGIVSVLQVLIVKVFLKLASFLPDLMQKHPFNLSEPYTYAIPYAVGAMLLTLLVDIRIGVFFSFLFGILAGISGDRSFLIGLYAMMSSCASVYAVTQYKQRTMVIQAGFLVSLANTTMVAILYSLRGEIVSFNAAYSSLLALLSGILVSFIVTILLPILEWMFRIPTDIRLLELSNFNQPLLRRLAMEAPGTHHHSLIVGDLAEIAAESIGANSLLARVGAYYHDIGKVSKAHYFIENIRGKNPHNELTPTMSAMIIRNHVKEGVELAKKHRLGLDIISIIQQHHGTSLLSFFYDKALNYKNTQDLAEDEFRYPGPRPRSKEAAIVLIADAVEAAARSLKSPSSSALKTLVQKITLSKFQDHQFDDCELTFRELTIIADKVFERLLRNYHSRIAYPGFNFDDSESEKVKNPQNNRPIKEKKQNGNNGF
ncbi:HDIG domain-containing protein [bacterium]|nr:HDIG domain-containing protein [candidate division CSSED10-310 bacterium]